MRDQRSRLDAAGIRVYAVTFESAARVRAFRDREEADFPILRDPGRQAYKAFGIDRSPIRAVWSPRTILYYARQVFNRCLPRLTRSDFFQLGGDVLVSSGGEVCWIYASREPADRPAVEVILREAHACASD